MICATHPKETLTDFMTNSSFEHEHNGEFYRLLNAVVEEPEKVPAIVGESRSILEETNFSGETALHWLAVENHVDGIKLLRSLGAEIPEFALIHAMEMGHTETVITLLELGADPRGIDVEAILGSDLWKLSAKDKRLIRSYFRQFGER